MQRTSPDISVILCTHRRPASLAQTLRHLEQADTSQLRCELLLVVSDEKLDLPATLPPLQAIATKVLHEPRSDKASKMNRALAEPALGDIVVFLDDDMSPAQGWLLGIKAICDRWPEKDLFTGRSYISWPEGRIPAWCRDGVLRGWAFSVLDCGAKDTDLPRGRWFSGNHFWFRRRVLSRPRSFTPEGLEPQFMLQLAAEGYRGLAGPDAVCGHRIQRQLMDFPLLLRRANMIGRLFATARLQPYKPELRHSRLLASHPLGGRLYCLVSLLGWHCARVFAALLPLGVRRMRLRLTAEERSSTYACYLRIAAQMNEYRLFR